MPHPLNPAFNDLRRPATVCFAGNGIPPLQATAANLQSGFMPESKTHPYPTLQERIPQPHRVPLPASRRQCVSALGLRQHILRIFNQALVGPVN